VGDKVEKTQPRGGVRDRGGVMCNTGATREREGADWGGPVQASTARNAVGKKKTIEPAPDATGVETATKRGNRTADTDLGPSEICVKWLKKTSGEQLLRKEGERGVLHWRVKKTSVGFLAQ